MTCYNALANKHVMLDKAAFISCASGHASLAHEKELDDGDGNADADNIETSTAQATVHLEATQFKIR